MRKRSDTKGRIVDAAWKLFYDQGYDNTTVEEIIAASMTSKGSFYHYFSGKDALLSSLSYLFDQEYAALEPQIPADMTAFDKLLWLNRGLFDMIERRLPLELMARMYASQLISVGEKHLLDRNRLYFRLISQIITEGQQQGQITSDTSAAELVKVYALCERALIYDWCLCNGEYSLRRYGQQMMPSFLAFMKL